MHTPILSMRLQLQRYLLPCRVRCRRTYSFFRKAELGDRKAECCFLACAWQSTPQLPLQRIRAWRERMRGNRLAQAVYGKCSLVLPSRCNLFIVVSDPRSHHRRCGLDPTAVSPAPPFSQVFAFDPSRERRVRGWLRGRRGALEAARQSLAASQLRM